MNMAFIIMQSCDYRYILSNSIGMQHQMRFSLCGEIENMRNYFNLNDQINNALIDLEIRRIGIDRATYDKKIISDWWIYGHNNIHENTADEIVTISCAPDVSQCPLFLRPDD